MLYQLSYSRIGEQYNDVLPIGPEPPVGIEPTTARLRIECSTPELRWHRFAKVEPRGIEPLTSAMPLQRSPS